MGGQVLLLHFDIGRVLSATPAQAIRVLLIRSMDSVRAFRVRVASPWR